MKEFLEIQKIVENNFLSKIDDFHNSEEEFEEIKEINNNNSLSKIDQHFQEIFSEEILNFFRLKKMKEFLNSIKD